ncbi:hypothetical protein LTR37_003700 [Vermiconidia calcicola]|uniref:Uncharacterized protein n=1 Tax=Vermiconidia calcicola TaxID=1690605 RepID=A0ACC3NR24_9PEZI|nr:hypothetical protein LTR37_003700 [Vermiconidia calcicola]
MALTQSTLTQSSASTTSQPSQPQQPPNLSLPPPQTFDILPALHELLSRIDHSTPFNSDSDATLYTDLPPLEPKELPTEVLQIKAKIRKALRDLEKLPDMERSVEEQEEEMRELEGRIGRQRDMVRRLGEMGRGLDGGGGGG